MSEEKSPVVIHECSFRPRLSSKYFKGVTVYTCFGTKDLRRKCNSFSEFGGPFPVLGRRVGVLCSLVGEGDILSIFVLDGEGLLLGLL